MNVSASWVGLQTRRCLADSCRLRLRLLVTTCAPCEYLNYYLLSIRKVFNYPIKNSKSDQIRRVWKLNGANFSKLLILELIGKACKGHLLTERVCFLMLDSKFWWAWGGGRNVFSFTLLFMTESFRRRMSFGLLSVSWIEFWRDVKVLCWDREQSFSFARIERVQIGLRILLLYSEWISSDLYPLRLSSSLVQGSNRCLPLTSLTNDKANFSGS